MDKNRGKGEIEIEIEIGVEIEIEIGIGIEAASAEIGEEADKETGMIVMTMERVMTMMTMGM